MNRGISLEIKRISADGKISRYEVLACGWQINAKLENVGCIKIDRLEKVIEFNPSGKWEGEEFYIPVFADVLRASEGLLVNAPLNANYKAWNTLLVRALSQILARTECGSGVSFNI